MYKIIGADQKQYGPISGDQIRQWISEGRVNGDTVACAEGTDEWKPLSKFPEFGFMAPAAPAAAQPGGHGPMTREEIIARDYSIDIMGCFSRGWTLFTNNFGTMFVTFLLYAVFFLVSLVFMQAILKVAGVSDLPLNKQVYFRPLYIIFGSLLLGPAMGGVFHVFLSLVRGQPTSVGEMFTGFKSFFQDLFLAKIILSAINIACMLPYTLAFTAKLSPFVEQLKHNPSSMTPQEIISNLVSIYVSPLPMLLIGLVPWTYFFVSLSFTYPLIVDKEMSFWKAITTSWKVVHKHWFHIFGLVILASLLNIPGSCMCYVGLLFTMPFGLAVICYAYEDIFGRQNTYPGQGA